MMSALIPNGTKERLQYIAKTYAKQPGLVLDMINVIANAVGEDHWARAVERAAMRADPSFEKSIREYGLKSEEVGFGNPSSKLEEPPIEYVWVVIQLVTELPGFRAAHRADPLFPWMALQLARAVKEQLKGSAVRGLYRGAYQTLREAGTRFAQWFEATRPDLTQLSLIEAMTEVEEWEQERQYDPSEHPGEVVYRWDDGFTVQKLTTEKELEAEGEAMQHCVGDYCEKVENEEATIYSVRDSKGQPHVTIEYDPRIRRIVQVQGKQNQDPIPKYKKYSDEFIATLPQHSTEWNAMYDELEKHTSDLEPGEIGALTERWLSLVEKSEDVPVWIGALSMDIDRTDRVEELIDEGVTAAELRTWPGPVLWMLPDDMSDRGWASEHRIGDLVRLARFAVRLSALKEAEHYLEQYAAGRTRIIAVDGEEGPGWVELTAFGLAEKSDDWNARLTRKGRRYIQVGAQLPLGLDEQPSKFKSKWRWDVYAEELERYGWDEQTRCDLELAERWAETSLSPVREEWDDFAPWYWEGLTPAESDRWFEVGRRNGYPRRLLVTPEVAASLQREKIRPDQVSEALARGRLSELDLSHSDRVIDALGLAANRRARV